ncbi:MAG: hypothetical protein WAX69_14710 [Victivallales bacterium]
MNTLINVLDLHDHRAYGDNMTPAVAAAIAKARSIGEGTTIVFPKGVYHFRADGAHVKSYYIANNDAGPRSIVFPVIGCNGITIDGGGSEFIFHGRISPFVIEKSANVNVRNFSIDYDRPFFTQGLILESGDNFVDIMIDHDEFPYRVECGEFVPHGKEWTVDDNAPLLMIEFDRKTKAPQYDGYWHLGRFRRNTTEFPTGWQGEITKVISASTLPSGAVRLEACFDRRYKPENMLIMCHESRMNAGFAIIESKNTLIESVDIFHAGGMGVMAQLSENVTCNKLAVRLRTGSKRLLSTNADATHFVNCTGLVTLTDCIFENMDDDATNVHGICTPVSRIISDDTVEVSLMHFQQHGVNVYKHGDNIGVLDRKSLLTKHTAVVRSSQLTDPEHVRIQFEGSISGTISAGDAIDNPDRMPNVLIRGCRTGNNRPRGFLISTPRKVMIEENTFYNSQSGIHISGDSNFWYETGAVKDVTIRRNRFAGCCYAGNSPAISILPEIEHPDADAGCFHQNITIEDNDFELHDTGMLVAKSVDGIRFINNRYRQSGAYPQHATKQKPVEFIACRNAVVE